MCVTVSNQRDLTGGRYGPKSGDMDTLISALLDPFLLVCTVGIGFFTKGRTRLVLGAWFMALYGVALASIASYAPTHGLALAKFMCAGAILIAGYVLVRDGVPQGLADREG